MRIRCHHLGNLWYLHNWVSVIWKLLDWNLNHHWDHIRISRIIRCLLFYCLWILLLKLILHYLKRISRWLRIAKQKPVAEIMERNFSRLRLIDEWLLLYLRHPPRTLYHLRGRWLYFLFFLVGMEFRDNEFVRILFLLLSNFFFTLFTSNWSFRLLLRRERCWRWRKRGIHILWRVASQLLNLSIWVFIRIY